MVLKTRAEIRRLAEIASDTLDEDRDGTVSDTELTDNYALAADELSDFDITSVEELRYWTSLYKPGTDVAKASDGSYIASDSPTSLRAECLSAYENGQLMDAALQIEGQSQGDLSAATWKLERIESAWRDFYESGAARYDPKRLKSLWKAYCDGPTWEASGQDPKEVFESFNAADLRRLYDGALLLAFLERENVIYDEEQKSFADFLKSDAGPRKGDCTIHSTLALHLFKLAGVEGYLPVILPSHVTLCVETSRGPVYLGAFGFQPPGYYENRPPAETIRRGWEPSSEPWQVLSTVYTNLGSVHYGRREWKEARRHLEAALEISPENPSAQYLLGASLENIGDHNGATEHYRKALDLSPGYSLPLQELNKLRK